VAGEDRLLTEEPGRLMEDGNYTTDVQIMFGANQQEGIYVMGGTYKDANGLAISLQITLFARNVGWIHQT
jgi:hypothetical protein